MTENDNTLVDKPFIGTLIEDIYSVGQFEDNHLYLIADENSSLAQKAIEVFNEYNAGMQEEDYYNEYEMEIIPTVELSNHPKIKECIEQYNDNMILQLSSSTGKGKRFIVAQAEENSLNETVMLMICEAERNTRDYVTEVLRSFATENTDEFRGLAMEAASSESFLAQYFANLTEDMMLPCYEMAASMSSIKERLDVEGVITHKQRMESYTHLLDNLKNYHKNKDPKIDAELDLVFISIDPATLKQFFLKQSPKLQEKFYNYINPRNLAETSTMDIEVCKMNSIDKNRKNDGYYRLFLKKDYESLMIHFNRKSGLVLYMIYLLDRKKNGDKVDTLNISQYKELFSKLYKIVYGVNGESIFSDMMKNFNADNKVQQKGLYTVLKSIRDDVGSACERMQEPAEPFLIHDISSHLSVLPKHIILPPEIMNLQC